MTFNPTKCTVIRIQPSKSRPIIPSNYHLHGHIQDVVDSSKCLGVNITNSLSWDKHIDNVTAKENRTLGFIRRNLNDCPKSTKEISYTSIMRPSLEYAATVWNPVSQQKIKAIENVQRRAARYVNMNYTDRTAGCVTNMISALRWKSLEQHRNNSQLCMLYKIHHHLVGINHNLYLHINDSRTRGKDSLFQEKTSNEIYRNSFFQRTVKDWNSLPSAVISAVTIEGFKANLVDLSSC